MAWIFSSAGKGSQGVEVGAKTPDEVGKSRMENIKHLHFGVFFDGTGNNMVSTAQTKNLINKVERWLTNKPELDGEIEKDQLTNKISPEYIRSDVGHAYSNVAKLYSAINKYEDSDEHAYYNIYIEGSGGDNLADLSGMGSYIMSKTVKGCGFGVGTKGVASLVAKACHFITDYINCIKHRLDENTAYHFYVFGFSRGSTCARLFCQLATREENSRLNCEPELVRYSRGDRNAGRLSFMEKDSIVNLHINRAKVSVEFLGIYDTVGSIGILEQIDGYINPLKDRLKESDETLDCVVKCSESGEYNENNKLNLHYNNVNDYGLYINYGEKTVKNVFHIGAADEYRENFAFIDIGNPGNYGCEVIMPGCHSDIGGSYVDYGVKERVLYRFVPRKAALGGDSQSSTETTLMDNGAEGSQEEEKKKGVSSSQEILRKRVTYKVDKSTRDSIAFIDPLDGPVCEPLNAKGLSEMGWIDRYFCQEESQHPGTKNKRLYLDRERKQPCTIRFADNDDATSRCVKFNHNAKGNYSNISLQMMYVRCGDKIRGCSVTADAFRNGLFKDEYVRMFEIPNDLRPFGEKMIDIASSMSDGEKKWVTLGSGFFSEPYRLLRLKYLHFTASCQLVDWKLHLKVLPEIDWANFGNECNYREDGKICRIRYEGTKGHQPSSAEGVKYLTASSGSFIHEPVKVAFAPEFFTK